MWLAEPSDPLYPGVKIFRLDNKSICPEPEIIFSYNVGMDLIVISGSISDDGDVANAINLAHTAALDSNGPIIIAVMKTGETIENIPKNDVDSLHLNALREAFHCVFVVHQSETDDVLKQVVRAISLPCGPDQNIGCDWNDVRTAFRRSQRNGRFGFGRGSGMERTSQAALSALTQINQKEYGIIDADGVAITFSATRHGLLGRHIKEVMRLVQEQLPPAATVIQSIAYDDRLTDEDIEVAIFAIGGPAAEVKTKNQNKFIEQLKSKKINLDGINDNDIPAFLRQRDD